MQEEKIQPEVETEEPLSEESDASANPQFRSHEWSEFEKTPDGQKFKQMVESGALNEKRALVILEEMDKGYTLDFAQKRRSWWPGTYLRFGESAFMAHGEFRRRMNNPEQIVEDFTGQVGRVYEGEELAEGAMGAIEKAQGATGRFLGEITGNEAIGQGTVAVIELPKSFVGTFYSAKALTTTGSDIGDLLDVLTIISGATRAASLRSGLRKAASDLGIAHKALRMQKMNKVHDLVRDQVEKALLKDKKRVHISKKLLRDMMNDEFYGPALQKKFHELKKSGKISKFVEYGIETLNLYIQNDELLLELLGYVGQKILFDGMLNIKRKGISFEDALDLAAQDFAKEYEQAPGWTPPEEDAIIPIEDQQEAVEPDDDVPIPDDETAGDAEPTQDAAPEGDEEVADEIQPAPGPESITFNIGNTPHEYVRDDVRSAGYSDANDADHMVSEIAESGEDELVAFSNILNQEAIWAPDAANFDPDNPNYRTQYVYASHGAYYRKNTDRHNYGFILNLEKAVKEGGLRLLRYPNADVNKTLEFIRRFSVAGNHFELIAPQKLDLHEYLIGIVQDKVVYTKPENKLESIPIHDKQIAEKLNPANVVDEATLKSMLIEFYKHEIEVLTTMNPNLSQDDFMHATRLVGQQVDLLYLGMMDALINGTNLPDNLKNPNVWHSIAFDAKREAWETKDEAKPTDEDAEGESPVEPEEAAAEEETQEAAPEDTEGAVEPEETAEDTEPRERLTLGQAQEQYGEEFSDEQVSAIDDPDRISIDAAMSTEEGSHFNVYQDMKNVGGAVRGGGRVLYFANDPKRTEAEAMNVSGSDTIYQTTKHKWTDHEEAEAFYPTFDSLSDMIDYMEKETDKRLGGTLEGTPDRFVRDSARKGRYRVEYDLVNINEVQGSHNLDGSENENYPAGLQPRDQRGSTVDLEFLDEKARDVAPEFLIDHFAQLSDGAPALSKEYPDASVSGSGRLYILKKMLQDYPEQWEKYRDYLRKNVHRYGKDAADVDGDPESILIRRIVDDVDEVQLAKDANQFAGLEDTSSEQASSDASYLRDDIMLEWKGKAGLTFAEALNHKDNLEFRQKLLKNIPARMRNAFLQSDGESFSSRGGERVRAMMLRYVFNGEYGLHMSKILIESKFGEIQNINNMLDVIVPQLALLESYFRSNRREAHHSIAEELARAVGMLNTLKENGDIVGDFFKQDLLFQPKTNIGDLNVPTLQMLYIMDHRIGAYQQLASIFMRYVNEVLELDPAKEELFADPFTKEVFFEQQLYDLLWANPTEILQKQLEAGDIARAKDITRAYVDNLMEQIRRQANQRSVEPTPPEPQPEPIEEEEHEDKVDEEEGEEPTPAVKTISVSGVNYGMVETETLPENAAIHLILDTIEAQQVYDKILESGKIFSSDMLKQSTEEQTLGTGILSLADVAAGDQKYVFLATKKGDVYQNIKRYGVILDIESLVRDGAIVATEALSKSFMAAARETGVFELKSFRGDGFGVEVAPEIEEKLYQNFQEQVDKLKSQYRFSGEEAITLLQEGNVHEVLVENEIDLNKYILGVVEDGKFYVKSEQKQEGKDTETEPEDAEPEPEAVTDEEYEQADRAYRQNIRALAQQYFRGILQGDFKGAKRLPNKVEFAEKYTLPRHMPEDVINDLVEIQKTISQYRGEIIDEARLREDVQTQFGAHVLQQYDRAVSERAHNEVSFSTPTLIHYAPKTKDTPAKRIYSAGENGDIFISVVRDPEEGKVEITFDIPGYAKNTVEERIFGRFTDKQARGAINAALSNLDIKFTYGDNPRTYAPALTEVQQRRIDKMPPIAEEKAFKDKDTGSRAGMAYAIPGLDPAMRIKVDFLGDNEYYIYVESEMVQSETGFVIVRNFAESPLDAVQRFLADYFDDSVWDGLNEDPDPVDDALDAQGVAGNMPSPLPSEIHLKPKQTTDGLVWLKIADAAGNENPDYSITVDPDPHGLDDGTMEVTVRFPNHKNIDAIMEMAAGNSPEEAAIAAIANLRQFEIGKGGLGSPSGEPYQSTNDTLLESLPPPVKSTERPFGELRVDRVAMEREKYSKSGDTQIYMFDGHKETPQVTVRRLGTKDDPMWAVEIRYPRYNAAEGISYAKTAKGAVNEVLKDIEGKDYKWKPLYKGGIYTEIDSVQNAINRRQFATTPAIERRVRGVFTNLRKGLHIDLRGYKITSHKELAVMGQLFRHPGLERFVDFYLDENYNIVGHEVVSFGVPGQAVPPNYPRVNYHMRRLNAKYFIQMHNHPGGPAMFSDGDKLSAKADLTQYGEQYLGQIVVNSLEYAEAKPYQDERGNWKIRNRDNIGLSEAELGWEKTQQKGFFRRNTSIRPGDPLYQYDVNSETGKLLKLYNESAGLPRTNVKREESYLKGIAKLAKYLQTELNWTTIFFKGRHGEILDVQEYKDLHLLEPAQLWSFIEGEARSRGGLYVDVFVGEGDWYKTKADIAKSSWNQVLNTQHKHPGRGGTDAGIQFAWFDGLKEDNRYKDAYQQMIPTYEFEAALGISGRLHETTIDSDYGVEHGLTTPSKERDAFIEDVITDLENGDNINPYDLYRIHFNESVAMGSRHDALINKFIHFVTNQWILSKNFDPNVKSPTDAVSTYDEFRTVRTTLTHAESYLGTRLAAITDKDRVLTINDDNGELATFARAAGAATVETTNTDGYVRDLFHQVLPGVADAVHNIDPDNIAREWVGPRPTVILLNVVEDIAQKLDEAMKILAPKGRVVFLMPITSIEFITMGRQRMDTYWNTISDRYYMRRLDIGGNRTAYVIDKRGKLSSLMLDTAKDTDELFAKIEELRHERYPLTEEAIGAEFTGVGPSEQTFTQPISNPDLPAGLRLAGGQSLSLPPTDRGGPGESQGVARPAIPSRPGVGDGVSDAERGSEVSDVPTQTDALSGMSATPTTTPMGGSGSELGGLGAGSVGSGADVDPEMAAEPTAGQMPLQEGQVSAGARGARTRIASGQTSVEDGTLLSVSGIGGYQTGSVRQDTELGIPVTRSVERDADDVPENTPTQIPSRLRSLLTTAGAYAVLPQTGKQVLDMMGKTGQDLVTSLKRIRNFGDNTSGSGTHLLDRLHPEWKDFVRERAKADNRTFKEVYEELNEMLVRHMQGDSNTEVPDIVDKIVKATSGYLKENFEVRILSENNNIFRQGLLFDINEDFVDKGYLKQEHRNEVEQDRPLFDKFMRSMGQQAREKGVVQGFVQDKASGNVYAVFVQSKTFYNRDTQQSEIIEGSETYMLEDPFGNKVKIEATEASQDLLGETKAINPLLGNHPDYTLLAYRDPGRQRWTGDRNAARTIWDDAVRDGMPDPLRDAFADNGLEYPDGANIIYSKIANIQQWEIVKDGHPLYIIKRIVPAEEAVQPTPFGSFKTYSGVHDAYADFTQKLLVYKAGEARDPIFLFKGKVPHKVWTPVENYFPHIVDWNALDPERNRAGFEAYAQEVADANQIPLVEALDILSTRIEEAKTKKYGNLEQTRQYVFPNYRKDFFNVLDYYIIRAGHRLQAIKEFGQRNDLLEAKLLEFLSDDETLSTMSPTELAVAKLRYAAGYSDFEKGGKPQAGLPFRNESGTRLEFTPDTFNRPVGALNITPMSPADWQALIEAEFIEVLDNGNMQFTPKGIPFLENPILLKGVFAKGIERIHIAEDIIIGQLGWRKGDRFDEVGKNVARNVRNFFGLTYLGRAFIPNLSQTVNVGLTTGWRNMIRGFFDFITSDKARGEAQDVGAFAIDVMHEFGGVGSFLSRALHQQLGATPRYQVGKFGPKSLSPFAKHWEDPSIKTVPWSPFFQVERLNRGISARAGKHHAIAKIKKMIRNPERSNAARERLLSIPHAHTLKPKLNAALSVPNLSVKDMNTIRNLTEKEVREQMPHLYPVYDFLAEYAKEMADFTQHRVESLDRFKWMRDNPVLMTAALFRSFSFAQTKMLKDRLKMEWKVMHTWMNEDMGIQNKAVTKALAVGKTGFVLIPHILLATGMWGTATNLLGRISRFQEPDEEDLSFFAGVVQAGGATTFGEILYQLTHWAQGAEEAFLGPAFGTMADLTTDVVQGVRQQNLKRGLRTPLRLIRPPGYGPSAYQFLESFGESTMPPAPTTTRRNRRTPKRRTLERRDLRK